MVIRTCRLKILEFNDQPFRDLYKRTEENDHFNLSWYLKLALYLLEGFIGVRLLETVLPLYFLITFCNNSFWKLNPPRKNSHETPHQNSRQVAFFNRSCHEDCKALTEPHSFYYEKPKPYHRVEINLRKTQRELSETRENIEQHIVITSVARFCSELIDIFTFFNKQKMNWKHPFSFQKVCLGNIIMYQYLHIHQWWEEVRRLWPLQPSHYKSLSIFRRSSCPESSFGGL